MASSEAGRSTAFLILFINLILYSAVVIISAWAVNHGIEESRESASVLTIPARIFPIYFPFGNMATGYVIILSLLAGVVGFTTSATAISNVVQWEASNLHAASAFSLISWSLTMLAMGFACKEINIDWAGSTLRSLEILLIILSGTQLVGMISIHAGIDDVSDERYHGGRV